MIVDPSAIAAIALGEPLVPELQVVMAKAVELRMSSASWVELGVVQDRRMNSEQRELTDELVETLGVEFIPLSVEQARIARDAHRRYGPRSGSAARLDMGDCFSYALAKDLDEPLLFVGDDFTHTDVQRVDLG